jgi:hypothetical protein
MVKPGVKHRRRTIHDRGLPPVRRTGINPPIGKRGYARSP